MLSKEKIEKAKEQTKQWIYNMRTGRRVNIIHKGDKDFCDDLETLLKYINQLEADNYAGNNIINDYIENDKKQNKIIYEILKYWKQDDVRSIEELKKYFENKVEEI